MTPDTKHIPAAIMQTAILAVTGDRPNAYGDAITNHEAIAALWSTYLNTKFGVAIDLSAADAAQLMVLFKIARTISGDPTHVDHYVDQVGYSALAARCAGADPSPIRVGKENLTNIDHALRVPGSIVPVGRGT